MSKKKTNKMEILRSSAAEYLSFVAATGEGGVEVVYADENIWLSQKMMGVLYQVETHTINYHLKKVFSDNELDENSVIRNFRITASDGKDYQTKHYKNFLVAINRAVDSCKTQQINVDDHFREVTKMVKLGSGAQREVEDYMLTRFKKLPS